MSHEWFPLSYGQRALWFMHKLAPQNSTYNVSFAARIRGELDQGLLGRAIQALSARHPSIRLRFRASPDNEPYQAPSDDSAPLSIVSSAAWSDEQLRLALEAEAARPFNLDEELPSRFTLFSRSPADNYLLFVAHHICLDGWSVDILGDDLGRLYARELGSKLDLPGELPNYQAYVERESALVKGERGEQLWSFWSKQLKQVPPGINLPFDRQRPAVPSYRGGSFPFLLEDSLVSQLKGVAKEEGVTLYIAMLAAFFAFLHRYSGGQEDILVGSTMSVRDLPREQDVVGYFVNPVVLRSTLGEDLGFRDFLRKTRKEFLSALEYREYPFPLLVQRLNPEREASRVPLIQVGFTWQKSHRHPNAVGFRGGIKGLRMQAGGLEFESLALSPQGEGVRDFGLLVMEQPQGIGLVVRYNADLFERSSASRMVEGYCRLLEGVVQDRSQPISKLPIVSGRERQILLGEWNDRSAGAGNSHRCIHDMFAASSAAHPEATAVVAEDGSLTYAELEARSRQLAHYLVGMGVKADVPVGVLMGRSVDTIVAIYGILKAGGAYLPLEQDHPAERLAYVLQDAKAPLVITNSSMSSLVSDSGARAICLDRLSAELKKSPTHALEGRSGPENLVYIIYTSGSTGKPKGVGVEHRQLVNYVDGVIVEMALPPGARYATVSTFAADLGHTVIFPSLCKGGELHIIPTAMALQPALLAAYFETNKIDCLKIVPSHLEALMTHPEPQKVLPRKLLVTGGESSRWEMLDRFQQLMPGSRWLNHYGPTETTVGVLTFPTWKSEVRPGTKTIPLGRPLRNSRMYLLDRHGEPVPTGVAGELYIGGHGVVRGYVNHPELTAERFLPDPFSKEPGARMYRTGDFARYTSDGDIEFLGRIDHQVKIRGYRIELGEIEATLRKHDAVRECLVIAREDIPGDKRLVAYLVGAGLRTPEGLNQIRDFVRARLPEYMVPSAFVVMPAIPLSPNGKVDRLALPLPEPAQPKSTTRGDGILPRNAVELELSHIFEAVLGVQGVSIRDNFFALGGHSLLAVRLISEVHRHFGKTLPLAAMLDGPTVEQLAALLTQRGEFKQRGSLARLQALGRKRPFFCMHPVGGSVLCYIHLAQELGTDQPFYGFQARGVDGEGSYDRTIEEMAARYVRELREKQPEGPYFLGGWSMGGVVAFEAALQLELLGEKVGLLALIDSWAPQPSTIAAQVSDTMAISWFANDLVGRSGVTSRPFVPREDRTADEQLNDLLRWARDSGTLPLETSLEQARTLFGVYINCIRAVRAYRPHGRLRTLTLFRATNTPKARQSSPDRGWGAFLSEDMNVFDVSGDHYSILYPPLVRDLSSKLSAALEEAGRELGK